MLNKQSSKQKYRSTRVNSKTTVQHQDQRAEGLQEYQVQVFCQKTKDLQ